MITDKIISTEVASPNSHSAAEKGGSLFTQKQEFSSLRASLSCPNLLSLSYSEGHSLTFTQKQEPSPLRASLSCPSLLSSSEEHDFLFERKPNPTPQAPLPCSSLTSETQDDPFPWLSLQREIQNKIIHHKTINHLSRSMIEAVRNIDTLTAFDALLPPSKEDSKSPILTLLPAFRAEVLLVLLSKLTPIISIPTLSNNDGETLSDTDRQTLHVELFSRIAQASTFCPQPENIFPQLFNYIATSITRDFAYRGDAVQSLIRVCPTRVLFDFGELNKLCKSINQTLPHRFNRSESFDKLHNRLNDAGSPYKDNLTFSYACVDYMGPEDDDYLVLKKS